MLAVSLEDKSDIYCFILSLWSSLVIWYLCVNQLVKGQTTVQQFLRSLWHLFGSTQAILAGSTTQVLFVGVWDKYISAEIFFSSILYPSSDITCPKKLTCPWKNLQLPRLILYFFFSKPSKYNLKVLKMCLKSGWKYNHII